MILELNTSIHYIFVNTKPNFSQSNDVRADLLKSSYIFGRYLRYV